jgi:TrwC relaxase
MINARPAQSPEYYLTPDCPTEDGQIEARWGGKDGRRLGLPENEFGTLSFMRLAKGLNPETGSKLTARLSSGVKDRIDVCMTVPKSVSIAIEVMGDERAKKALWEANNYAMRLFEKKAKVRERKGGVHRDRVTGSMIWASFYHGTTRPIIEKRDPSHASFYSNGVEMLVQSANDNQAKPDPASHIHNYVFNASFDKAEGIWKAMKRHHFDLPEIQDKFHKRLAKNLRKIGYQVDMRHLNPEEIEPGRKPRKPIKVPEIRGISEEVQAVFSRRQGEIKIEEAAKPYLNADGNATFRKKMEKAKAQLSQVVRQAKPEVPLSKVEIHKFWVSRLTKDQFDGLADVAEKSRRAANRVKSASRLLSLRSRINQHLARSRQFEVITHEHSRRVESGKERGARSR